MSWVELVRSFVAISGIAAAIGNIEATAQEVMPTNMRTSVPIFLKCPLGRTGNVELIYRTHNPSAVEAGRSRLVVSYIDGVATSIILQSSETMSDDFKEIGNTIISAQTDSKWIDYAQRMTGMTDPILTKICFGTKVAKAAFFGQLERNRNAQ